MRYGLSRNQLVDAFGSARDHWIETDFQGWLGANKFYEVWCESSFCCSILCTIHSCGFFLGATAVCFFGPVNGVYWSVVRWKVGELGLSRTFGAGSVTLKPSFGIMFGLKTNPWFNRALRIVCHAVSRGAKQRYHAAGHP